MGAEIKFNVSARKSVIKMITPMGAPAGWGNKVNEDYAVKLIVFTRRVKEVQRTIKLLK